MLFENVWLLAEEVFEELCEHEGGPLVLLLLPRELVLDLNAVVLHLLVAALRRGQFLFNALQFGLQKVDQVLAFKIIRVLTAYRPLHLCLAVVLPHGLPILYHCVFLSLESFDFSFEPSDLFLTFVGSLSELLFDLLVKGDVPLQHLYLLGHLVVRVDQLVRILRLVVELGGQLVVLQDRESSLRLQLLVVQGHKVRLSFLHFEVHLLGKFLDVGDLIELLLIDFNHALFLLLCVEHLKSSDLRHHILLPLNH